jgi:hypothetical protein
MLRRGLCSSSQKAKSQTRPHKSPSRYFSHLPSYLARFSAAAATSRIKRISMWFLLLCAKDLFVEANAP